ncbi:gluconokinase [Microcoleus sp. FACHB-672]|uniref:gluconokinase n=1 Tax=Microcoleus sp. FACHB-672 TaxID=2692825 RepID=UPI0016874BEF|nr:gluconokinase [Microcoleus sp. FACHB-672]MBD2041667.1 gluconokinase [Microcoleus sp. FACHB-672]
MIVLVMGVSGSGKSTIGLLLAQSLNWHFSDADAFHPPANIEKMSRSIPLDDADRQPWIEELQRAIDGWLQEDKNVVLACSALKDRYRQLLVRDRERMKVVYLKGSFEAIEQRLRLRADHFMKSDLLRSQFDSLEEPQEGIYADVTEPPATLVENIRTQLGI